MKSRSRDGLAAKGLLQFMLKSQQKVDIKLSKMCQWSHQKLSEWQKAAPRFTENVVKTHENVGVVSSYLSGYLSTSWILLNKGQPATEFWWHRWWLLQTVPGFADFAGFAGVVENKRVFYLDELYDIRIQFCLFKQHWRRNYRAVYPTAHKVCLWFFWFN